MQLGPTDYRSVNVKTRFQSLKGLVARNYRTNPVPKTWSKQLSL